MSIMRRFQEDQAKKAEQGQGQEEIAQGVTVTAVIPQSVMGKRQAIVDLARNVANDVEALSKIKSVQQKEKTKAETIIPKYMKFVESLMESAVAHPVLTQILVWLFDIKDIPRAISLGLFCIKHNIPMPERFKRDLPTFLCDVVLDWAEGEFDEGRSPEPYFEQICEAAKDFDLHDQVTAKIHRLKGLIALSKEDYAQAVESLTTALKYGAKVKTALADATKQQDAQTSAQAEKGTQEETTVDKDDQPSQATEEEK